MSTMIEAVSKVCGLPRCVPPDPEREGYHWVRRFRGGPAIPLHWNPTWWHNADRGWGVWGQPDREDQWEYLGPCPSPDDTAVTSQQMARAQNATLSAHGREPCDTARVTTLFAPKARRRGVKGWKRGLPPGKYYEGMENDYEVSFAIMGGKWHRRRTEEEKQAHISQKATNERIRATALSSNKHSGGAAV